MTEEQNKRFLEIASRLPDVLNVGQAIGRRQLSAIPLAAIENCVEWITADDAPRFPLSVCES